MKTIYNPKPLGFRDYIISLPHQYDKWEQIGAHSNSEIRIHFNQPTIICGGLNGTAITIDGTPRIRFFINDIAIGESDYPQRMTDKIVLPKGTYKLKTEVCPGNSYINGQLSHSVWVYKPGKELSTIKNTLFTSAAAFGGNDDGSKTRIFVDSAAQMKVPIELYDTGQEWKGWYEHKIKNFLLHLYKWKRQGYEYIWYLDSRDIVFRMPVEIILGKFNAMYDGRIIIGKDLSGSIHPLNHNNHWILGALQQWSGINCELNSGCIAGHVDHMIKVYESIMTLREEYLSGIARNELLAKLYEHDTQYKSEHEKFYFHNDDQALHFINYICHPEYYQIDVNKSIHAMVDHIPSNPKMCDNPLDPDTICAAPILHGSRAASRGQWEQLCATKWWEEDESKRENIPIDITALEINAVYSCNLKCEYCTHMSQCLSGQVPAEEIEQWIDNWKHKVSPREVRILGGEPFLHEHMDWIVYYVYNAWPNAKRIVVTNGLIEGEHPNFVKSLVDTGTNIICSIHYNTPQYKTISGRNIKKWQDLGIQVEIRKAYEHWAQTYQIINGQPTAHNSNPTEAYQHCISQRRCLTLLDNQLYLCPQAAFYKKAYLEGKLNETWRLAADYQPLSATCTQRELARFCEDNHASFVCRLCPERQIIVSEKDKANIESRPDFTYLSTLTDTSPVIYGSNKKYNTAVGIVTCNSGKYIQEVIAFNYLIGFDKIIIVVDRTTDDTLNKIAALPQFILDKVDVIDNGLHDQSVGFQHKGYKKIYEKYIGQVEWLAFFDDDEYIYDKHQRKINDILANVPSDVSQVVLPWIHYGHNNRIVSVPKGETRLSYFTKRHRIDYNKPTIKSIARMDDIQYAEDPGLWYHCHWVRVSNRSILASGTDVGELSSNTVSNLTIVDFDTALVHYIIGSMEDYVTRNKKWEYELGLTDSTGEHRKCRSVSLEQFNQHNDIEDDRMLVYHDELLTLLNQCK